jgi:hypothetical protein
MSYKVKCYTIHGLLGTYIDASKAKSEKDKHEVQFPDCDVDIIGSQHWQLLNRNEDIVNLFRTREKARTAKRIFEENNPNQKLILVRIKPE